MVDIDGFKDNLTDLADKAKSLASDQNIDAVVDKVKSVAPDSFDDKIDAVANKAKDLND